MTECLPHCMVPYGAGVICNKCLFISNSPSQPTSSGMEILYDIFIIYCRL